MKILCCWNDYMAHGPTYETVNIFPALEKLGHTIFSFPLINKNLSQDMRPLDCELLDIIKIIKPELMIFLEYKGTISPEIIKEITDNTPTTTLFVSGDEEKYFNITKMYSPNVNNMFTTFRPAIEKHKAIGCPNVIFGGYYANNQIYKKYKMKQDLNVSFAGARTEARRKLFNKITTADIGINVFGNGWESKTLDLGEYVGLINKTKVNINVSTDIINGKEIVQVKGRDFEVPMCGGFLLTQRSNELGEFYKQGIEVGVYEDNDDAVSKVKYYLKHETERKRIAEAGYKRAQRDHTSDKRWKYILSKCIYKGGSGG
jgi:spore maturation protein CgeB